MKTNYEKIEKTLQRYKTKTSQNSKRIYYMKKNKILGYKEGNLIVLYFSTSSKKYSSKNLVKVGFYKDFKLVFPEKTISTSMLKSIKKTCKSEIDYNQFLVKMVGQYIIDTDNEFCYRKISIPHTSNIVFFERNVFNRNAFRVLEDVIVETYADEEILGKEAAIGQIYETTDLLKFSSFYFSSYDKSFSFVSKANLDMFKKELKLFSKNNIDDLNLNFLSEEAKSIAKSTAFFEIKNRKFIQVFSLLDPMSNEGAIDIYKIPNLPNVTNIQVNQFLDNYFDNYSDFNKYLPSGKLICTLENYNSWNFEKTNGFLSVEKPINITFSDEKNYKHQKIYLYDKYDARFAS